MRGHLESLGWVEQNQTNLKGDSKLMLQYTVMYQYKACYLVVSGITWYYLVLSCIICYYLVLSGITWYYLILSGYRKMHTRLLLIQNCNEKRRF